MYRWQTGGCADVNNVDSKLSLCKESGDDPMVMYRWSTGVYCDM
jgi:hypothetical protein